MNTTLLHVVKLIAVLVVAGGTSTVLLCGVLIGVDAWARRRRAARERCVDCGGVSLLLQHPVSKDGSWRCPACQAVQVAQRSAIEEASAHE